MTALVGILNVTPDSFAEAAPATAPEAAIARARQLLDDGADVLDIGAESTRPGARALTAAQEWDRLAPCLPPIVALARARGVTVSLDTRHPDTARRGIEAGVDWINDVGGAPEAMARAVAPTAARLVVMHAVSIPADAARRLPPDADPVAEILAFLRTRIATLEAAGIAPERIILDPGFGFGKSPRQQMAMLARFPEFAALGRPVLAGHSRKSFLSLFTDAPAPERDDVTLALSGVLMTLGADYLRVHDVARHARLRADLAPPPVTGAATR